MVANKNDLKRLGSLLKKIPTIVAIAFED